MGPSVPSVSGRETDDLDFIITADCRYPQCVLNGTDFPMFATLLPPAGSLWNTAERRPYVKKASLLHFLNDAHVLLLRGFSLVALPDCVLPGSQGPPFSSPKLPRRTFGYCTQRINETLVDPTSTGRRSDSPARCRPMKG
jgi:hypothetical protein